MLSSASCFIELLNLIFIDRSGASFERKALPSCFGSLGRPTFRTIACILASISPLDEFQTLWWFIEPFPGLLMHVIACLPLQVALPNLEAVE